MSDLDNLMENKAMRKLSYLSFYTNNMFVSKDHINLNYLKLTYQTTLLKDLFSKHK